MSTPMEDIKIPVDQGDEPFHTRKLSQQVPQQDSVFLDESAIGTKVRISFSKFVQLVVNHSFEEVVEKNQDAEIIISTNLLSDLANAHPESEEQPKKMPVILFIIGLGLGIVITYFLVK